MTALVRENLVGGRQSTGQYIMKVSRNCASGSLVQYAKESLKSNQISALVALMKYVCVHPCGTPNLYGLKAGASAGTI